MALKTLLVFHLLGCSSAACIKGEENCLADYEEEDTGFAQIKAHAAPAVEKGCINGNIIALNWADIDGANMKETSVDKWGQCQTFCDETPGCFVWTHKYSLYKPVNNCWLKGKSGISWPNSFRQAEDKDTISGGPLITCYAYDAIDRADTCDNPDDPTQTCRSSKFGTFPNWENCAKKCNGQSGCESFTYVYNTKQCYGKSITIQQEFEDNGGLLWYNPDVISGNKA